jgi:hypothetical protein
MAPTKDTTGNLVLNTMVNLTNMVVNNTYTATAPPFVALTFLSGASATQAAGNDVLYCYMPSYTPQSSTTPTTQYVATGTSMWNCLDFNVVSTTAVDYAADTNQTTYSVSDSYRNQTNTNLNTGFIVTRPYTVNATS